MRITILYLFLLTQLMRSTSEKEDYGWRKDGMRNKGIQMKRYHSKEQAGGFVSVTQDVHQKMFFIKTSIPTSSPSSSPSPPSSSPSSPLPTSTCSRPSFKILPSPTDHNHHTIPTNSNGDMNRFINKSINDSIVPEVDGLIFKQKDGSYVGAFQLDVDIQTQNQSYYSNQGTPNEASIPSFGVIHLAAITLCFIGFLLGLLLTIFALRCGNRLRWTRLEIV